MPPWASLDGGRLGDGAGPGTSRVRVWLSVVSYQPSARELVASQVSTGVWRTRCFSTISGTSSALTWAYQTSSGKTKTTGPSSWRRVQALRSTADGGSPSRLTSLRKASSSSLPPLTPHLPSPGVAHTKISRNPSTYIFYDAPGSRPKLTGC